MEFKKVKLKEFSKIIMGQSPKSEFYNTNGKGTPFLQGVRTFGEIYPRIDTFTTKIHKTAEKGDVLFTVRAPVGEVNISPTKLCIGRGLASISSKNNKFLYYLLKSSKEKFNSVSTGTIYSSINKNMLENLEFEIPDDESAKQISEILSNLDSKIEINNKIISNLESQAQAIFKSWFVDFEPFQDGDFVESELGMIPEGWEVKKIKDISKRINGFSYTSKDIVDESNINMITIKNFDRNGGLQNDSIKPISKNSRIKKDHYLKTNDILMACTDLTQKADIIGGVILYFENEKFDSEIFSMDLIKLVPFEKDDTFFFYYYLKNPIFKLFAENASSGTTVLHLSKKAVDNFNIVYPTKKHIDRFNDYVFPIIKKQRNLLTQNAKLAELRDALLPKLMAGEIDVSNIKIDGEEVKNE